MNSLATAGDTAAGISVLILWLLVSVAGILMWWLPVFIAHKRRMPNIGGIALVTGLAGWSGIGWIAALVMACMPLPAAPPPYNYGPPPGYSSGLQFPPPPPPHFPAGPFPPPQPQTGFRAPDQPR